MIVVAILDILTAIAIPKFTAFKVKAGRAESSMNLKYIYQLQGVFFLENKRYGSLYRTGNSNRSYGCRVPVAYRSENEIGFKVDDPCKLKYTYFVTLGQDYFN
jgi:Tfp pilus assembly protein PilE